MRNTIRKWEKHAEIGPFLKRNYPKDINAIQIIIYNKIQEWDLETTVRAGLL